MPQKKAVLVKPLSKRLIEKVLDNIYLGDFLTRDHDGDPTLIIPSDKGAGDLEGWLLVNADFFHLVCTLGPKIPRCQWPIATAVCNMYYRYSILGRAVLNIRQGQDEATLRFEAAIDCSEGVSEAFLQTFIVTHIASACLLRDIASSQKVWSGSATTGEDTVIAGRLIPLTISPEEEDGVAKTIDIDEARRELRKLLIDGVAPEDDDPSFLYDWVMPS